MVCLVDKSVGTDVHCFRPEKHKIFSGCEYYAAKHCPDTSGDFKCSMSDKPCCTGADLIKHFGIVCI